MIKIICVGNIKEKYFRDAILEYTKRIGKYSKIEILEINDEAIDDEVISVKKEEERLLKVINPKDYIITLEIDGGQISSVDFAKKIDNIQITNPNITFIIGGSCGLGDNVKKMADFSLSFSKMTFPHQLFRIMLLEQIYRAYKIKNNERYHKWYLFFGYYVKIVFRRLNYG